MNKFAAVVCALFFTGSFTLYAEPAEPIENKNVSRTFSMPLLSYSFITLGDIQTHSAAGGLTLYRFNPNERGKSFSVSMIYTPQVLSGVNPDIPHLYHTAALSIVQKINRHTINGSFIALTDKPVYGGLRTFMGMAGYSYDLINGRHFSMDIGGSLVVMDVGLTLDNGMPWLIWPIPSISLSWDYEWINFGFMPGVWMTIGPKFPISLNIKAGSRKYDASLWYRRFRNGNPLAERLGIGIGTKRDSSNVMLSDGGKYGIHYDAIYGSLRLFRFIEISGGWAFNGKEGYDKVNWETLFESSGYTNDTMYNGNIGNGYFVSLSLRMSF
jgi:hypothetical protein